MKDEKGKSQAWIHPSAFIFGFSACGAVWQRTCLGRTGSKVRILPR
jgi:hypothetical protein